jgi:hypothetical protein
MTDRIEATDIEKTNLETHVELSLMRYSSLEDKIDLLEKKLITIQESIEKGNLSTIKILIGTAGTIIASVLSTLIIILTKH